MNVGIFCDYFENIILGSIKNGSESLYGDRLLYLHDGDPTDDGTFNDITTSVLAAPIDVSSLNFSSPTYNSTLDQWETLIQNDITFTPTASGTLRWLSWGDGNKPLARVEITPSISLSASTPVTIPQDTISFAVRRCGEDFATNILTALLSPVTSLACPYTNLYIGLCNSLKADNTKTEPALFSTRTELLNPSTSFSPAVGGQMTYGSTVSLGTALIAATINAVGFFDASALNSGNLIFFASLPSPINVAAGDLVALQSLLVSCE